MADELVRRITFAEVMLRRRRRRRRHAIVSAVVAAALSVSGWATTAEVVLGAPATFMDAGSLERASTGHDVVAALEPSVLRPFGRLERRDLDGIGSVLSAQLVVVPGVRDPRPDGVVPDFTPALSVRGLLAGDVAGRAPPAE